MANFHSYECLECKSKHILSNQTPESECPSCSSRMLQKVFDFGGHIGEKTNVGVQVRDHIEETKEKLRELKKDKMVYKEGKK